MTFDGSNTQECSEIPITDDDIYEEVEMFIVSLDTVDEDVTLEPNRGSVAIVDNDGG